MTHSNRLDAPLSGALFDELLVMLAQQGDEGAMARLHKRWTPRLQRAALRYTGDVELARDLAQECWLSIWKGLKRLRSPDKFRAFAFTILRRRGADHLKKAIQTRNHSAELSEAEEVQNATQDDRVAIRQAFASLPPDQRLAAHLHFVEGLTLREIAQVQDIAEGTAKSRLFVARRKLKQALSGQNNLTEGETP